MARVLRAWRLWVLIAVVVALMLVGFVFLHRGSKTALQEGNMLQGVQPASNVALKTMFGVAKQVKVSTQTQHYEDTYFSIEYPIGWLTTQNIDAKWASLPGLKDAVGFAPPNGMAEHILFVSRSDITQAITSIEHTLGRIPDGTETLSTPLGAATKVSFTGDKNHTDKATYYMYRGTPSYALRVHGPGNLMLDAAATVLLRTFTPKEKI